MPIGTFLFSACLLKMPVGLYIDGETMMKNTLKSHIINFQKEREIEEINQILKILPSSFRKELLIELQQILQLSSKQKHLACPYCLLR